jgi:hypothetical protein
LPPTRKEIISLSLLTQQSCDDKSTKPLVFKNTIICCFFDPTKGSKQSHQQNYFVIISVRVRNKSYINLFQDITIRAALKVIFFINFTLANFLTHFYELFSFLKSLLYGIR